MHERALLVGLHGCQKGDDSVINRRYQFIHAKDRSSLNAGKRYLVYYKQTAIQARQNTATPSQRDNPLTQVPETAFLLAYYLI